MANTGNHRWKFLRAGGVDQVLLRNGADILNLPYLDQKLWVALACPVKGLEFDQRTLELLDVDKDARIRAPEILAAVEWIKAHFKNADDLVRGGDSVPLSAINDQTPAGAALLASARRILLNLGKDKADAITLADVTNTTRIFVETKFNGDGVIPVNSASDPATTAVLETIIALFGSVPDRSGKPGVDQAKADAFFNEIAAFAEWHAKGSGDPAHSDIIAKASGAMQKVRAKADDYFARCRLAEFDGRALALLNRTEAEFASIAAKDLTLTAEEIAKLPLARVESNRPLPLREGVNPAWQAAVAALDADAARPLLGGPESLSEADWRALQAKTASYEAWMAAKPATSVEKLSIARIREVFAGGFRERVSALIQEDVALEAEHSRIVEVEKLVRVQRDFFRLLNNFVSFADFYSRRLAVFQAGTLYLDARSCDLCVRVDDAAKHAALGGLAKAYLAYCNCSRINGEKMTIAAAFTAGDSDYLMVGRNGVFYDRQGRDWDATIVKVIENPISVQQAFWAPYKKFVRLVEEQVAKRAAAADTEAQGKLSAAAEQVATADKTKAPAKPAEPKKMDVGTVAALGVALGSIGGFLVGLYTKFIDLGWWIPVALIGLMLAISGPSMLIAYLKLRQRNLGPILDANGWAVNGRMGINVPFGGVLSQRAKLPPGAEREVIPGLMEKHTGRNVTLALLILLGGLFVAWRFDFLNSILPARFQHKPAASAPLEQPGTNTVPAVPPAAAPVQ